MYITVTGCSSSGNNTEAVARRYFTQLLSGLDYCHKRGILTLSSIMGFIYIQCTIIWVLLYLSYITLYT